VFLQSAIILATDGKHEKQADHESERLPAQIYRGILIALQGVRRRGAENCHQPEATQGQNQGNDGAIGQTSKLRRRLYLFAFA
jgi:hypothetical protein